MLQKNVLVAKLPSNTVRAIIADFGYSLCDGEQEVLTSPRISAKQSHCAPELLSFPTLAWPSPASDVFACASSFVELLFGRPLNAQSYRQTLPSTGYRELTNRQWGELGPFIQRMWCEDPAKRPSVSQTQEKIRKIRRFKKG